MIMESSNALGTDRHALDVACGLGHNAIWIAQQGWQVDGADIAAEGLNLARQTATNHGCEVSWIEADLDEWIPTPNTYDLAIVFRFLDRETVPRIVRTGLRPGGWLVYETFSSAQLKRPNSHIRNPTFTLAPGELPKLFPEFDVIVHCEDVLEDRTVSRLLARKL